jgi:hypothetical protein
MHAVGFDEDAWRAGADAAAHIAADLPDVPATA